MIVRLTLLASSERNFVNPTCEYFRATTSATKIIIFALQPIFYISYILPINASSTRFSNNLPFDSLHDTLVTEIQAIKEIILGGKWTEPMIITQHYRATSAQWSTRPSDAQHVDDAKFELPFGTRAKRMMVDESERERGRIHIPSTCLLPLSETRKVSPL